ncbi:hypothetical protein GCM10009000_031980 [Halobacterium noricense]
MCVLVTGCTGQNSSNTQTATANTNTPTETPSPTPTSTPSPTASPTEARPNEAEDEIDRARESLSKAVAAYNDEVDTLYSPSRDISFSTSSIQTHLTTADSALESARTQATDEQTKQIDFLRGYYEFVNTLLAVLNDHAAATGSFETGRSQFSNGQYQTAIGTFRTSKDHLQSALDGVATAKEKLGELEDASLEGSEIGYSEALSALNSLTSWFGTMDVLLTGYESHSLGMSRFNRAGEIYNEGFYDSAKGTFSDAIEYLNTAAESYPSPEDTDVQSRIVYYNYLECRTNNDLSAAKEMKKACVEMQNGNKKKANELVGSANEHLLADC